MNALVERHDQMELRGIDPLTYSMRARREPAWRSIVRGQRAWCCLIEVL
jgi:hypothetical protein